MHTVTPPQESDVASWQNVSTVSQASTKHSSPELCNDDADALPTPKSIRDDYVSLVNGRIVPKVEEIVGPSSPALAVDAIPCVIDEPLTSAHPARRKRGRPRKHPVVEQKTPAHPRSKTGCGTCRRRKKKCDEAKPNCANCEKNNVVCDGYEGRQPWQSGKEIVRRYTAIRDLRPMVAGIDTAEDQEFYYYFFDEVSRVLSLTDDGRSPFVDLILPMAMSHEGLMHTVLFLAGNCLVTKSENSKLVWEERQEHHSSLAMKMLREEIDNMQISKNDDSRALATIPFGDPIIAQSLILCLQTVTSGDLSGAWRHHLNAMKDMLIRRKEFPNERLRQLILEFLIYHDYSSSVTSLANPLDDRSLALLEDLSSPEFTIRPEAASLLGVIDGLFGIISRIRQLRDRVRANENRPWESSIMREAWAIDHEIRAWRPKYKLDNHRFATSLLYRQVTWIYLERTIQPSIACPLFSQAVDDGLGYLRTLPVDKGDGSMRSVLLLPLFLLGCAAFVRKQQEEIAEAFRHLQDWSAFGNIKHARAIVEELWALMNSGHADQTWDWEKIIADHGWDFFGDLNAIASLNFSSSWLQSPYTAGK